MVSQVEGIDNVACWLGWASFVGGGVARVCQVATRRSFLPEGMGFFRFSSGIGKIPLYWNGYRSLDRLTTQWHEKSQDPISDLLFLAGAVLGVCSINIAQKGLRSGGFLISLAGSLFDAIELIRIVDRHQKEPEQVTAGQVVLQGGITLLFGLPSRQIFPVFESCRTSVVKVWHPKRKEWVALKRAHVESTKKMIRTEATMVEKMRGPSDPHLMPLYDVYHNVYRGPLDEVGIVMPLMEGSTLEHFVQNRGGKRLTAHESVTIMLQVLEGVSAMHRKGILHHDIKPQNVFMLHKSHEAMLFDFGCARTVDPVLKTVEPDNLGSLPYMAPETFVELTTIDQAAPRLGIQPLHKPTFSSDVYSLGITLFQIVTGHHPYNLRVWSNYQSFMSNEVYFRKLLMEPPRRFRDLLRYDQLGSSECQALDHLELVCQRATQFRPENRWQSVEEFSGALRLWQQTYSHLKI
ncbi:MAG: serine/threonine protein kinase [Deltaproteobacteria bacterium]|nr:serine/threonine protein kinase [Deltaproteobacteria bacterium]